jgi:hypothetical protein
VRLESLQTSASGTALAARIENTTDHQASFTFQLRFFDGAGQLLGAVPGPSTPVQIQAHASQQVTASSGQNLSGYVYLAMDPVVTPVGLHPVAVRTGTAGVDRVIDAVMQRGADRIDQLVTLSQIPCTRSNQGIPDRPQCPEGTAEGTPIAVFPGATCQPFFLYSQEQARRSVEASLSRQLYVYAVLDLGQQGAGVILASSLDDARAPTLLVNQAGQIVGPQGGCGTPDAVIPPGSTFLLPPVH